jgi:hypothetical protein
MIDLTKFCSDSERRPTLQKPFTFGDFTYATDGAICVRVQALPDAELATKSSPAAHKLFDDIGGHSFFGIEDLQFPRETHTTEDCDRCQHECPTCECWQGCEHCDGEGRVVRIESDPIVINGVPFDPHYIRLIKDLPSVEFAKEPKVGKAARFKFEGGDGLVMPLLMDGCEGRSIRKIPASKMKKEAKAS